jgi:hypothetical protein
MLSPIEVSLGQQIAPPCLACLAAPAAVRSTPGHCLQGLLASSTREGSGAVADTRPRSIEHKDTFTFGPPVAALPALGAHQRSMPARANTSELRVDASQHSAAGMEPTAADSPPSPACGRPRGAVRRCITSVSTSGTLPHARLRGLSASVFAVDGTSSPGSSGEVNRATLERKLQHAGVSRRSAARYVPDAAGLERMATYQEVMGEDGLLEDEVVGALLRLHSAC